MTPRHVGQRIGQRIGLFGGSFDPVHRAHIEFAASALEQARLESLWFLPVSEAGYKNRHLSAPGDRLALLRASIQREPRLALCLQEWHEPGIHYSADTVEVLQSAFPGIQWIWLIGEDSFNALASWRDPERLLEAIELWVCPRPGAEGERPALWKGHPVHWLDREPLDISSTALRESLDGRGVDSVNRALLAPGTERIIAERGLYFRAGEES